MFRTNKHTNSFFININSIEPFPCQHQINNKKNIFQGCMEHLTYEDIEEKYPEEYAAREASKLTYRYPSGESYQVLKSSE